MRNSSWRPGLEIGCIYELDDTLLEHIGSYPFNKLQYVRKHKYVLAYKPGGDCFTYCLLLEDDGDPFRGLDVENNSFGFYAWGTTIVMQCTQKEMYQLLAGGTIIKRLLNSGR